MGAVGSSKVGGLLEPSCFDTRTHTKVAQVLTIATVDSKSRANRDRMAPSLELVRTQPEACEG
jgi:hypothetical protein